MSAEPSNVPPHARASFRPRCCECDFRITGEYLVIDAGYVHPWCSPDNSIGGAA